MPGIFILHTKTDRSCTFAGSKGNLFVLSQLSNLLQVPSPPAAPPTYLGWCLSAAEPPHLKHEGERRCSAWEETHTQGTLQLEGPEQNLRAPTEHYHSMELQLCCWLRCVSTTSILFISKGRNRACNLMSSYFRRLNPMFLFQGDWSSWLCFWDHYPLMKV